MGLKKETKMKLILSAIGLVFLLISIGTLTYISSKTAELNIYKLQKRVGPIGSPLQGLAIKFKKEDISCFGLIKFDCTIKNSTIWAPLTKKDYFKIKEIKIGTFTKNGIFMGNKAKLYIDMKNLSLSETNNTEVLKNVFPMDLNIIYNIRGGKGLSETYTKIDISTKAIETTLEGNVLNKLKDINRTDIPQKKEEISILKDFKIKIVNKEISDILYDIYSYFYKNSNIKEAKQLNSYFLDKITKNKIDKSKFKMIIIEKLKKLSENKDFAIYTTSIIKLLKNKNQQINITAKNKKDYTINEIINDKNNIDKTKYFDIKIGE